MRSRQINFFISNQELAKFNKYIKANGWAVLYADNTSGKPETAQVIERIEEYNKVKMYLVQELFLEQIEYKYIEKQNYYVVDSVLNLPVIELSRPYENSEENYMRRGRLYYILGYFNSEKVFTLKPDEFLKAADKLFKAFRRTFKNQKPNPYKGFIITAQTQLLVVEQGLELKHV